jgi:hypothetical protein
MATAPLTCCVWGSASCAVEGNWMSKAEFVRTAPTYYYAAVATLAGSFTISGLRRLWY